MLIYMDLIKNLFAQTVASRREAGTKMREERQKIREIENYMEQVNKIFEDFKKGTIKKEDTNIELNKIKENLGVNPEVDQEWEQVSEEYSSVDESLSKLLKYIGDKEIEIEKLNNLNIAREALDRARAAQDTAAEAIAEKNYFEAQVNLLTTESENFKKSLDDCNTNLEKAIHEIDSGIQQNQILLEENETLAKLLKTHSANFEASHERTQADIAASDTSQLIVEKEMLESSNLSLKAQIAEHKSLIETLQNLNTEVDTHSAELNRKNTELKREKATLKTQNTELKTELDEYTSELEKNSNRIRSLEMENRSLRDQLNVSNSNFIPGSGF